MAYKANAKRNEDGSYTLSYGKGSKKLTAILYLRDGAWVTAGVGRHKLKRDAIAEWEAWAASNYGGTESSKEDQSALPQVDASPAPHSGPPRYKAKATAEDELTDNDRAFFAILAEKHGDLTEWQRAQARNMLRRIGWPGRLPQEIRDELEKSEPKNPRGARPDPQRNRPQVSDAPAAQDTAPASPAGSEQAASAHDRPPQDAPQLAIPRYQRPDARDRVQPGGAAQPAGA